MPVPSWALCSIALGMAVTNAHAQAPATPPSHVRQQGEQLERLQQDREEAQRRQLQASPSALTPPTSEQRRPWPEMEAPCRAIQEVALVGDSSESFQWVLVDLNAGSDPAIGRCLGGAGVNVAAERAQQRLECPEALFPAIEQVARALVVAEIDGLQAQINQTSNPKEIAELQARIAIEQANIQADQTRIQLAEQQFAAESALLEERGNVVYGGWFGGRNSQATP